MNRMKASDTLLYCAAIVAVAAAILAFQSFASTGSSAVEPSQDGPLAASERTRLVLLGTGGGPVLRKERSQPASLLLVDGEPYLIDIGYGTLDQLTRLGVRPASVRSVFITHQHSDHTADLVALWPFAAFGNLSEPIAIYGPYGTDQLIDSARSYFSVAHAAFGGLPALGREMMVAHEIEDGGIVFQDDTIEVTAIENTHYQFPNTAVELTLHKSYSLRFETPDRVVVFTGDTGPSAAVTQLAQGADILVSEVQDLEAAIDFAVASNPVLRADAQIYNVFVEHMRREHLAPEDIGRMAAEAGVKMVVLTHFGPGADGETDMSPYTAGVRELFGGPVIAGRDLDEF